MKLLKSSILCRTVLLSTLLFLSFPVFIYAQGINYQFPRERLPERMSKLSQLSGEMITYDATATQNVMTPSVDAHNQSVQQVLGNSLQGTGYAYQQNGNTITIYKKQTPTMASDPDNLPLNSAPGTLKGKVLDENGELLPGATVKVVSGTNTATAKGTATNSNGDFELKLPAGTYTLEIGFLGYQTQQVTDVKIVAGKTTPLDITLGMANKELSEVVITANYNQASAQGLYARQKSIAAMSDGVSADLIKKTSDNNVAQVLKRVSGVTIDNGKYVTVRGMSERYNNVQLNGASLPSTEPNRRNFAFDVIPTGLVDNVTIAKTFTPDLPGEFTGGLVEVNTLAVPDKKFLNLSVGTGWNSISTGKDFLSNKRFGSDWWLGEIDKRQWFAGTSLKYAEQNMRNAGKMNTFGMRVFKGAPTQNYSITGGLPINLGNAGNLGMVAALTYRHDENKEDILEGHMITSDSISRPGYKYKFATSAGAVANIGWQKSGHKVTWRNLWNNRFTHSNHERYIYDYYDRVEYYEQYSVPLQSNLWQTQLDGEHKLFDNKLIVAWNGSINGVTRTNPDDRLAVCFVAGKKTDGTDAMHVAGSDNRLTLGMGHLMYSKLEEKKKNFGINLEHPFVVRSNRQSIKAGYLGTFRNAMYEQQYMTRALNIINPNMRGLSIPEFFDPKYFDDGTLRYQFAGLSGIGDYYKGEQDIHAGYVMGEFSFFKKLRLITGVRAEKTDMSTTTTKITFHIKDMKEVYEEHDSIVSLKRTNWLPAATLIYTIRPELNLRAAYSKTLARPDFRELSSSSYYNVDDRVEVINLHTVEMSQIHNWDTRVEWYPRPGEVVSIGYFYKKFIKPVEMVMRMAPSQQSFDMFNINLEQSTASGVELNWRKSLGFISPVNNFLKDMYFTGNYTWMKAEVSYNSQLAVGSIKEEDKDKFNDYDRTRPLQGLSPYTINLGLAYEGIRWGAAVNYNRNGRKLIYAGVYKYEDQYENPRDVLDLQLSARFLKSQLEIKFNASDILNQDIIVYKNRAVFHDGIDDHNTFVIDLTDKGMNYNSGDWVTSRIRKGVNFSVSASWKF